MEVFIAPVASGIVGAFISAFGVYVAITNRLTRLETLMEQLKDEVEKHNQMVERTYKLEADNATIWKRHDELTGRVERLEQKQ